MANFDAPLRESAPLGPIVYIVGTPIGNLKDMTFRAVQALKSSDIIAAEDTRVVRRILSYCQISGKYLESLYDQVEQKKSKKLIDKIIESKGVLSFVSDAGTPCVSDPGFYLVKEAVKAGVKVIPVPGVSALTTIISVSTLPNNKVYFVGFLPKREEAIKTEMSMWKGIEGSIVFFESSRRILDILHVLMSLYPLATICVGREMTKKFEEIFQGSLHDSIEWLKKKTVIKGEFTIMIHLGKEMTRDRKTLLREDIIKDAAYLVKKKLTHKDLVEFFSNKGLSKKELYQLVLELKKQAS